MSVVVRTAVAVANIDGAREMRLLVSFLCLMVLSSCSPPDTAPRITHPDWDKAAGKGRYLINVPEGWKGSVEDKNGKIAVTNVVLKGKRGWAIDYHLMFVARSDDAGKTWRVVNSEKCHMPWGLHVVSEDCAWVWGSHTTETPWYSTESSIIVTRDGGKTWYQLPEKVDFLYNVEVLSEDHVIVFGRIRPDIWPEFSDPLALPVVRLETFDGGKTFKADFLKQ